MQHRDLMFKRYVPVTFQHKTDAVFKQQRASKKPTQTIHRIANILFDLLEQYKFVSSFNRTTAQKKTVVNTVTIIAKDEALEIITARYVFTPIEE